MAEIRSIYTDKRRTTDRNRQTYVNGTAVRKLQVVENPKRDQERRRQRRPQVYRTPRREKVNYLSVGYTLFLTAASILALWVCAGYLQLQADNTAKMKNIAALEAQLSEMKAENDDEYNRVTSSVDLEEVRDIAINELGMVYAQADQVILYDGQGSDYVRQYEEIPQEKNGLKGLFGTKGR
ncbi:hypothetical protein D5278_04705 [bacterium 1XD21-13]|nr:hypothetical protein [bacterium 1XD21-13]